MGTRKGDKIRGHEKRQGQADTARGQNTRTRQKDKYRYKTEGQNRVDRIGDMGEPLFRKLPYVCKAAALNYHT